MYQKLAMPTFSNCHITMQKQTAALQLISNRNMRHGNQVTGNYITKTTLQNT